MIRVTISKSTGKVTHYDPDFKMQEIRGLPPKASLKAVRSRMRALGLREADDKATAVRR